MSNVPRCDSSHGDTAILCEVYGVVLGNLSNLLGGHTSKAEHTNLVSDVLPVVGASLLGKAFPQGCPHTNDPVCHCLNILHPFFSQGRVGHNLGSNPGTVTGRVRVEGPDNDLDLGFHPGCLVLVLALHSEGASPLAVEAHVLRKALSQEDGMTLVNKEAEGSSIAIHVSAGKALVGHVEEGQEVPLLDNSAHLLPLLKGGINPCGIVSAGVQEDNGALGDV